MFLDIKGYEGLYQVSNYGRVRSLNYNKTGEVRMLKGRLGKDGYLYVGLCKDGKPKFYKVHRLVAEAFIPNPDNLPCVNHKDECKQSNVVSNLEFCDVAYNNAYGTRIQRVVEKEGKRVYQYTRDGEFVRSYPSTREAERQTGIANQHISACCLGKPRYKSAGGFVWSFNPPTPSAARVLF